MSCVVVPLSTTLCLKTACRVQSWALLSFTHGELQQCFVLRNSLLETTAEENPKQKGTENREANHGRVDLLSSTYLCSGISSASIYAFTIRNIKLDLLHLFNQKVVKSLKQHYTNHVIRSRGFRSIHTNRCR